MLLHAVATFSRTPQSAQSLPKSHFAGKTEPRPPSSHDESPLYSQTSEHPLKLRGLPGGREGIGGSWGGGGGGGGLGGATRPVTEMAQKAEVRLAQPSTHASRPLSAPRHCIRGSVLERSRAGGTRPRATSRT